MQKLTPLTVVTVPNLWVVELLTQLGHVVAWDVFLLLKLIDTMREGTVVSEFTFAEVDHVFAHFCLFLLFDVGVEFLSFLIICEGLLDFLAGCLAISLVSGRGMIRVRVLGTMMGRYGVMGAVINLMWLVVWHEWLVLLVMFLGISGAAHYFLSMTL